MSGVKGRSGRKKSPRDVLRYLTEQIDDNWGILVNRLIEKASNGDREALMYCFDRRLGKPKQQADIDIKGEVSVGTLVKLLGMMERDYIEGGSDAIQITGGTEGSQSEVNGEEARD